MPSFRRTGCALDLKDSKKRTVPATFTVTNNLDDGSAGSLRAAIAQANANVDADTILFDPSLAGAIIGLDQGVLRLETGSITIDGSGLSTLVTISGNHASTVFRMTCVQAELRSLIVTAGNAGAGGGGAIGNGNTALTVKDCTLTGNSAAAGGGIYNNSGKVTIIRSILSDNSASQDGGANLQQLSYRRQ